MLADLNLNNLTAAERAELDALIDAQRKSDAKHDLITFAQSVFPRFRVDPVHRLIAEHLQKVANREIMRFMLFVQPQIGKSTLTSIIFPSWWLGNNPDDPIVHVSYADNLAHYNSGEAKAIIESESYQEIFPNIHTRPDSRAKNRWNIVGHRGGMVAAGIGGRIAGKPGGLAIIDDPVGSYEDALSETIRNKTWSFYDVDLYQRLWEHAPIVMIMTRWHEDDLAGRILHSPQAHKWTVLRLPALCETQDERDENNRRLGLEAGLPDPLGRKVGEAVAPSFFSTSYLNELKGDGTSYRWNALYMGAPRPAEGNLVKREWLKIVDNVPFKGRRIRYWDKAATSAEAGGARTAGVLICLAEDGYYYVEDVIYGHWLPHERDAIMKQTAEVDAMRTVTYDHTKPDADPRTLPGYGEVVTWSEQEPGSGGKEAAQATVKLLSGFSIWSDKVTGDKTVRFMPFASQAGILRVRVKRAGWNEAWIDEVCAFPNGMYRDMADATGGAFNKLETPRINFGIASADEDHIDNDDWR